MRRRFADGALLLMALLLVRGLMVLTGLNAWGERFLKAERHAIYLWVFVALTWLLLWSIWWVSDRPVVRLSWSPVMAYVAAIVAVLLIPAITSGDSTRFFTSKNLISRTTGAAFGALLLLSWLEGACAALLAEGVRAKFGMGERDPGHSGKVKVGAAH